MKIIFRITLLIILFGSSFLCAQNKFNVKYKNVFTLQKNSNWKKGFVCGAVKGFYRKNNDDSMYFYIEIIKENEMSLFDFIKQKNERFFENNYKVKVDAEIKNNENGDYYSISGEYQVLKIYNQVKKRLIHYYKIENHIFMVEFVAEKSDFDKYLNEVKAMMNSFRIIKK